MFEDANVFGGQTAFEDEAPTPALPGNGGHAAAPPVGASPDGLGATYEQAAAGTGAYEQAAAGTGAMQYDGMGATWGFIEPADTSPSSAVRSAGFTALFVTLAVGTGIAVGGPWGAAAGLFLSGGAANVYRAQKWWGSADPSDKHEAVVSAVFAAFGVGLGGYAAYKAYEAHSGSAG